VLASSNRTNSAFRRSRADQITLHIGEPAEYGDHQSARARSGIRPWLRERAKLRPGIDDTFDDREQVEGAPSEPINSCHCHDVASRKFFEEFQKLAAISPCTAGLLPVDLLAPTCAKLLKLRVESLAIGADSGVPKPTILWVSFDHILRKL